MKPVEIKSNTHNDSSKEINKKVSNLKLVIMLEYQNIKKNFATVYTSNWSEEVFVIKKA